MLTTTRDVMPVNRALAALMIVQRVFTFRGYVRRCLADAHLAQLVAMAHSLQLNAKIGNRQYAVLVPNARQERCHQLRVRLKLIRNVNHAGIHYRYLQTIPVNLTRTTLVNGNAVPLYYSTPSLGNKMEQAEMYANKMEQAEM
jgi:hypothetical protein